jgi:type 1 fimbria pilin
MRRYILLCTVITVTLVFSLLGIGYATDDSPITRTERWESTADGSNSKGVWTFSKKSDGGVTVAGEWTYVDFTCPFTGGSVTISGPSVSFTATGTARYSSATIPGGFQDSPFTLEVKGETRDGKGKGTYSITFSATGWPSGFSGKWQATRTEGGGISE